MPGYGGSRGGYSTRGKRHSPMRGGRGGRGGRGRGGRGRGGRGRGGRSQHEEQEYNFDRIADTLMAKISTHKFERNFYVPSDECTSMTKESVKEWTKKNAITITAGYSEYMSAEEDRSGWNKKWNDPKFDAETGEKKEHVLKGKVPNPVLEFDHCKWPEADDIAQNLSKTFERPTAIQSATWPLLLSGLNVIGVAKTGSGKTLAFLLPAIVHMRAQPKSKHPRALVVLPTRELALQVENEIKKFAKGVTHVCVYGGASAGPQLSKIDRGVQLVVATPGRLMDYISKGQINMGEVTFVVWDEADRLLDMGFKPQLDKIMEVIRSDKQMLMFSATWPHSVRQMACEHMLDNGEDHNVVQVAVGSMNKFNANEDITQKFIFLTADWEKDEVLYKFLCEHHEAKVLVFMGRKKQCQYMEQEATREGFKADSIHGGKKQSARESALERFKKGHTKILFATDVAGRGIHVDDIEYVINYDLPDQGFEDYIHRIGRTARAGKKGTAISYFVPKFDSWCSQKLIKMLEGCNQEVPEELRGMPMRSERRNGIGKR